MTKIQPVILAGGTGSRLWPLSRELYPKQLLRLTANTSLLQTTLQRVAKIPDVLPPVIVVGEGHRFITLAQVEDLGDVDSFSILLEPEGKNTAPAICGAAHFCKKTHGDVILLVLPADHVVMDEVGFVEAVGRATELAAKGAVVTFGIQPISPETGYGYIEQGEGVQVASFKEKPDAETARKYVEHGGYYWNSGMFAFSLPTALGEIEKYAPDIYRAMEKAVADGEYDGHFFRFEKEAMATCPSDSIDYALMEKTDKAAVVVADIGWSDIGSWKALWEVMEKDTDGNVTTGDVLLTETRNCFVKAESRLVATVGMEDTLVVETADAVIVSPLSRSQDVKKVVKKLKEQNREEYNVHLTVYRPWGSYTVLEEQSRFQIKKITVTPGAKLSLQKHHHRSEHWVVVRGTAEVTNGDEVLLLHENQSTYIPAGTMHRLGNPGVIELELIEVQNGSYLGEDDIVRFDDVYGRENDQV
ncbi:mannose-1-phosphate guanylyltransferase/mannose-6-phosphate isomerase [Desulforhopalus sp. IMCC35007]|uniref:mannose-1-phosphate guanylyltransferase/mannose-6-phosphate isomerase n=1 Tax=Desulforhopalus sp. IMCC35007 TaxID=2569543 RepID=UPI0010AE1C28|nr:mannose-1-phosphate guanylyltransferase/mannose-6-phosphate isomerase [Desulforhopalus sp. IMCC35007]TKB12229.1 mannose-1-phosphate guanylyltransferase/mannose-6-phosphate isomerase [Desulforhopalus sp. IMCC35007]